MKIKFIPMFYIYIVHPFSIDIFLTCISICSNTSKMKFTYPFALLSLVFVPVHGLDLIDALVKHGFTKFAKDLQLYPDLMKKFEGRNDVTVWAPVNEAVTPVKKHKDLSKGHSKVRRGLLLRRQTNSEYSAQISHSGPPPGSRPAKRGHSEMSPSNFVTLRSFLENPEFVNLGPHQPGRFVSSYQASPDSDEPFVQVSAGGGETTDQVSGPFKYDYGLIYGVNSFFTLPSPLDDTLDTLGFKVFQDAVDSEGLKEKLSETPAMVIFAFADHTVHGKFEVKEHTISGFLGYTPELIDGGQFTSDAGTTLTVKFKDGDVFVNGIRIVKSDIIIKNGVIHQLEGPLSTKPSKKPVKSVKKPVKSGKKHS